VNLKADSKLTEAGDGEKLGADLELKPAIAEN
jgi:hypothetical protein